MSQIITGTDPSDINHLRQGIYAHGPFERRAFLPIIGPESDGFFLSQSAFGQPKTFKDDVKHEDLERFDPVNYINAGRGRIYPDVSTNVFLRSPEQMDGVIEAFPIKSIVSQPLKDKLYNSRGVFGWSGNKIEQFYRHSQTSIPVISSTLLPVSSIELTVTSTNAPFAPASTTTQSFTIPSGHNRMEVYAWGAGGGTGLWLSSFGGGAGGFVRAKLEVVPGDVYKIIVGLSGSSVTGSADWYGGSGGFGGGGTGTRGDASGGGGGGYSGIFRNSVSHANAVVIAGGGGGGTGYSPGGGGGGITGGEGGQNGTTTNGGLGGSQTEGGDGSNGITTLPAKGQALQGGTPGSPGDQFILSTNDGGGGGGGYYGGGAGGDDADGGGGGSSYVTSSALSSSIEQGESGYFFVYSNPSGSGYFASFGITGSTGQGAKVGNGLTGGNGYIYIITSQVNNVYSYQEIKNISYSSNINAYFEDDAYNNESVNSTDSITKNEIKIEPFDDNDAILAEQYGETLSGADMIGAIEPMDPGTEDLIPDGHKSSGAGFTYENAPAGTDSIAYGGLKR